MDIFQFYELSRSKSGVAIFPVIDTRIGIIFEGISTRNGNGTIDWGDGSIQGVTLPKNVDFVSGGLARIGHTYTTAFSGNIKLNLPIGLKDVYSLSFSLTHQTGFQEVKFNIQNFGEWINQFSNLYSILFNLYAYQQNARMSIIKGNLADIPNSLKRYKISSFEVLNNTTDYWFNFSTLQGKSIEYIDLNFGYPAKIIGDLNKLPTNTNFVKIQNALGTSSITYTSGKVWASSFDTLYLPIALTPTETDNLFIDANNSIITAIGGKLFDLKGNRTPASDIAVAGLIAKGFTVNCFRGYKILDLPLQNNFTDYSENVISMVAANVNGLPSFVSDGSGGYAVDFGGTKSIKTAVNLPISTSDKVTVSIWININSSASGVICELNTAWDSGSTFLALTNNPSGQFLWGDHNSGYSNKSISMGMAGTWRHVVFITDRTSKKQQIYINKVLVLDSTTSNDGNFGSFPLFIGQRNGTSLGFIGQIKNLKIFNYPLSAAEIAAL